MQAVRRAAIPFCTMTTTDFKPMAMPTPAPVSNNSKRIHELFIKDSFTLSTLLGIGALTQALVFALLPARYSLLPVALLIGRSAIITILQIRTLKANPLLDGVIPGRVTAQFPLPLPFPLPRPLRKSQQGGGGGQPPPEQPSLLEEPSFFGNVPASEPLVVFHLGIHFHHPLGRLAPGGREVGAHFQAMAAALSARRDEFGMVSSTLWQGTERGAHNAVLFIGYFRSAADLHRFAHDPIHRDGWDWYHRFVRETGYRHFGVFHETFVSRRGEWETVYVDSTPTLLGAGNVKLGVAAAATGPDGDEQGVLVEEGEEEEEEVWIRPLVSADHPALRSQAKRMRLTLEMEEDPEKSEIPCDGRV